MSGIAHFKTSKRPYFLFGKNRKWTKKRIVFQLSSGTYVKNSCVSQILTLYSEHIKIILHPLKDLESKQVIVQKKWRGKSFISLVVDSNDSLLHLCFWESLLNSIIEEYLTYFIEWNHIFRGFRKIFLCSNKNSKFLKAIWFRIIDDSDFNIVKILSNSKRWFRNITETNIQLQWAFEIVFVCSREGDKFSAECSLIPYPLDS